MIQDIGTGKYKNEYRPVKPDENSKVIFCRGRELFLKCENGTTEYLSYGELIQEFPELSGSETYLFSIEGVTYYLFRDADKICVKAGEPLLDAISVFEGYTWEKTEFLRTAVPKEAGFAGSTGYQLAGWYNSRRFCPRCGHPTVHDEKERMMKCPVCGQVEYPKICPAVIVGVTHGDRLLLTKYAGRAYTHYALIAGFAEIGETIEETVVREVMEEVGLKVTNLRYYKSQPWSFSDTLLMGFFAEVDGNLEISLDEEELAEGKWCTRDEIPEDDGVSLTREMMRVFKEGKI